MQTGRNIPKEQNPFYVLTTKETSYIYGKPIIISDSEINLPFTYKNTKFEMTIKSFNFGIFRIVFDLPDKTLKYKNKVNIGSKLVPKKFKSFSIDDTSITLITEDENEKDKVKNLYKIFVDLKDLEIFYYINNELLTTINHQKKLNLLYDLTTTPNLKSNLFDMTFHNINECYGLPERPQHLFIKDGIIKLYNTDNFEQIAGCYDCTYGSIPMLHGVNKNRIVTIFNNNSSDQYVDIKTINSKENGLKDKTVSWMMEGGIIDLYLFSDTYFTRNQKKIAEITGYAPLPPLWIFGYHQCRYGYKDCEDVMNVHDKFLELNIPIDCYWLDIEHTDEKKYFTWNPKTFPQIKDLLDKINSEHKYFVTIIDPHIKADPENYPVCKTLLENDCFVKTKDKDEDGKLINYMAKCWPGDSYYPDFFNCEKVLPFYKEFYLNEKYFFNFKNLGTWVDMNEPAVFDVPELDCSMPKDNIHFDGTEFVEHREVHNLFGYYYQKVATEALRNRLGENKRAFTLSRSFYAGSQCLGFIWTGDQGVSFDFLHSSIETNMINCLCGLSGTGSDVGGFVGDPTDESMKLWYSLGIFYPFFRGHSDIASIRREPWLWEKETCEKMIESIRLRYHLLMYTYTTFYLHTKNGIPIIKPIWMKFRECFDDFIKMEHQGEIFVFGDELVGINHYIITDKEIEVLNSKINTPIYDLHTGQKLNNGGFEKNPDKLIQPLIIGGSVIPWTEKADDCSFYVKSNPLTLKIFVNQDKCAIGRYYLDDGESIDTKGIYIYEEFELNDKKVKIRNCNDANKIKGTEIEKCAPVYNKIEIYGYGKINKVSYLGKETNVSYKDGNDLNVIDLLADDIKVFESFEICIVS